MSGYCETRTWAIFCDACRRAGPTVISEHRPPIPGGWSSSEYTVGNGWQATSGSRVVCDNCAAKERSEADRLRAVVGEGTNG
jgi:hypothetical protein